MKVIKKYLILSELYNRLFHFSTINLTYFWNFGIYARLCLIIQIITGIFLAMYYISEINVIFSNYWLEYYCNSKILYQMFLPYFFFKKTKGFSVSIFYNFFNLYEILKKYEEQILENLKKEKKWSKSYNIYYLIYILYSIFCLIIIILGFIINIIKILLYIILFCRFINFTHINITIFLNLNYFYKFIIICILIYYLYIVYLTLKQIIKKIFIYLKIFYLYFTQYKNFNIFSIISNEILLLYFINIYNITNYITNYLNYIFISYTDNGYLNKKIFNKWHMIYNKSKIIKILILNNLILKILKYLLFYCLIISLFYNLYSLNLNEYIELLQNIQKNLNTNINYWNISYLKNIIKYYNLLILYKFYLFLVNFYTLTFKLGIPDFIIISLSYILPINVNNTRILKIYDLIFDSNLYMQKFLGIKFIYGNFSPIILYIISILITIILIYILLNLFLQWCFYKYYNQNNSIQELILKVDSIILSHILHKSLEYQLEGFYTIKYHFYDNKFHFYSNNTLFNLKLTHYLLQTYLIYKKKFIYINSEDLKIYDDIITPIENVNYEHYFNTLKFFKNKNKFLNNKDFMPRSEELLNYLEYLKKLN